MVRTLEPHPAKCAWCELDFDITDPSQLVAMNRGLNVYCSLTCRSARERSLARTSHVLGPCPTCGKMYPSRTKWKKFCSLACYTTHPDTVARLRGLNDEKRSAPKACPNCGKEFQHKSKKFCGNDCRRQFYVERFDRWIANPEQIALPQNFDEFMIRSTLPCLVLGCEWEGENLANHVNFTHGITADKFRELVGFNQTTGLVGSELRARMSDYFRSLVDKGIIQVPGFFSSRQSYRAERRLEGKEHAAKAMAMRRAIGSTRQPTPCVQCGKLVAQPVTGKQKYCSTKCRSLHYIEAGRGELRCDYCGNFFMGVRIQVLRAQRGQKVCCSHECRNKMNMTACLIARKTKP